MFSRWAVSVTCRFCSCSSGRSWRNRLLNFQAAVLKVLSLSSIRVLHNRVSLLRKQTGDSFVRARLKWGVWLEARVDLDSVSLKVHYHPGIYSLTILHEPLTYYVVSFTNSDSQTSACLMKRNKKRKILFAFLKVEWERKTTLFPTALLCFSVDWWGRPRASTRMKGKIFLQWVLRQIATSLESLVINIAYDYEVLLLKLID